MAFSLKDINSFVREGYRGRNPDIRYEQDYRGAWSSDEKKESHSPSIAGFGFRTSKTGRLSWVLDYRPYSLDPATGEYRPVRRYRRMKLGDYPSMTLEKARRKAEITRAKIMSGIDPLEKSPQEGLTLKKWSETYLQDKRDKDFRSVNEMARRIDLHILPALGHKRMVDITTSNVYDLHKKVGGGPRRPTYEANRVLSRLSDLFTRARKAGKLPKGFVNPCLDVEAFPEIPRERVLSTEEAQALVDAIARTEHQRFEALTWLLILTGIRISEARTLRWDDIELLGPAPRMSIHRTIAKNKQTHYVALNAGAVLVLNQVQREQGNDFVFPSPQRTNQPYANQPFKKVWDRVRQEADLWEGDKRIRWHDLRRTFLAIGNALNYPLHTLGRLVNQKTLSVTADYAQVAVETTRLATNSISSKILSDFGEPTISNRTRTRT